MRRHAIIFLMLMLALRIFAEDSYINSDDAPIQFALETEQGFAAILNHTYQSGESTGTNFDFRTMGGQEILLPIDRYTVTMTAADRHRIQWLYQPLEINTDVVFRDAVTIDGVTFPDETAMNVKYGFPFYRLTYSYDFLEDEDLIFALGGAIQLRNASIRFTAVDGTLQTVSQNLGPVPALNLYTRWSMDNGLILTAEATGLYASSAFINGASFTFEGSILDASLRMGYQLKKGLEIFGNARFLGGSAVGVSEYPDLYWTKSVEDYTANYLSTLSITLGLTAR